ncbi:superoxide dismutase family protein [Lacicoccus alkaliphilus]|uniref:Superoxide dismutase, Cu-Zn family n=1 Tax=Lacicoccus alkaliphilus DSM 16010 TaxID=1123231 RepID=A0A1M7HH30_9BACL|nr:superoxide dismutase family protein [Salinicoccus alkaliphilus]SHM27831.1 superoxide dismutase, Cu-Zn family [Salinicoccus alkaliphilus DSM 16010]
MKRWAFIPLFLMVFIVAACGAGEEAGEGADEGGDEEGATQEPSEEIEVTMYDTDEEPIGTAVLSEADDGVTIALEAEGLEPGEHGMHIHDAGLCQGPNFETAGDHFNPTDASHGFDHEDGPHAGDLENIEVAEDGTVSTEVPADNVTILDEEVETSLMTDSGTSLIIHSDADDYVSQPSGDAGDPIACGVITEPQG